MTKYSNKIPDEQINDVITGETTPEIVAQENVVPVSAVHNKKNRVIAKKPLSVGYNSKTADKNLPKEKMLETRSEQSNVPSVPLDATEALKGFWGLIDGVLQMVGFLSKDQIQYEKMTPKDIDDLANVSNTSETMRKIASVDGASMLIVVGYAGTKFMPRIKVNIGKHNEKLAKENKCKCDDCKKQRELKKIDDAKPQTDNRNVVNEVLQIEKTKDQELAEFIARNSDPTDLKKADEHIEKMKTLKGVPHIVP